MQERDAHGRGKGSAKPDARIARLAVHAAGTISLEEDGPGTVRTVAGGVKVKVPLYGGKVEGWIVAGLRSAYDEEARRLAAASGVVPMKSSITDRQSVTD